MLKLSFSLEIVLLGVSSGIAILAQWYNEYMYHQKKYHDMILLQWIVSPLTLPSLNLDTSTIANRDVSQK